MRVLVYMTIPVIGVEFVVSAVSARAEQAVDITTIRGARVVDGTYDDDPPRTVVPAYPSLFMHPGGDGPHRMPTFSRPDGTPIAVRHVAVISSYPDALVRIDLDAGDGEIVVHIDESEQPVATYVIDPTYQPKTRTVDVRPTGALRIDSDAVEFEVFRREESVEVNEGRVMLDLDKQQRVVALYPNGTEEVIFDGAPRAPAEPPDPRRLVPQVRLKAMDLAPLPATLLLLLVLGLVGVIAARYD